MILVADSGSTKTDWKYTDGAGRVAKARTEGINPYYISYEDIEKEVSKAREQLGEWNISNIFFYGAGCSSPSNKKMVYDALSYHFPQSEIEVNNDMLGAARALCGTQPGIACILGTGSGSCVYDGEKISKSVPSLGFILGDEGSGAYLGKQLVKDYLREEMPEEIINKINHDLGITKDIILENVNRKPMPSRYLAGFAKFIGEQVNNKYVKEIVSQCFLDFVQHYIIRYEESARYKIHFVGSIARIFRNPLREVLEKNNLQLGKIEEAPVEGLIEFHLQAYS